MTSPAPDPPPPPPPPQKKKKKTQKTNTQQPCLGWMGVKMQVTCPPKFQVSNKCLSNADVGAWRCWWWGERSRAWWNLTKHRNKQVQYCVPIYIKCFDSRYCFLFYCYFKKMGCLGVWWWWGRGVKNITQRSKVKYILKQNPKQVHINFIPTIKQTHKPTMTRWCTTVSLNIHMCMHKVSKQNLSHS